MTLYSSVTGRIRPIIREDGEDGEDGDGEDGEDLDDDNNELAAFLPLPQRCRGRRLTTLKPYVQWAKFSRFTHTTQPIAHLIPPHVISLLF